MKSTPKTSTRKSPAYKRATIAEKAARAPQFTPQRDSQLEDAAHAEYRKWKMSRKYTGKDMFIACLVTAVVVYFLLLWKVSLG